VGGVGFEGLGVILYPVHLLLSDLETFDPRSPKTPQPYPPKNCWIYSNAASKPLPFDGLKAASYSQLIYYDDTFFLVGKSDVKIIFSLLQNDHTQFLCLFGSCKFKTKKFGKLS
jgi:hypothetical protein